MGYFRLDSNINSDIHECGAALVRYSVIANFVSKDAGYFGDDLRAYLRQGFEANMSNVHGFLRLSLTYDRGAEMAQHSPCQNTPI